MVRSRTWLLLPMLAALAMAEIDDDPLAVPDKPSKSKKDDSEGDFALDLDFDAPDPNSPKAQKAAAALKDMKDQHVQAVGSGDAAISFLPTMSKSNVQKILNSVWIAQSAAQLQGYDKQADPIKYFKFFNTVLKALGWTVGVEKWQQFKQSSNEQYMGAAVIGILIDTMEALATGGASALGTGLSTLKSLKNLSKDGKIPMFKGNSEEMEDNSFQIGTCSQDVFDIASMASSVFTYKTDESQGGFWFWAWKTHSVKINFQAVKMALNDEVYEDARPKMVKIRRAMADQQMKNAVWQVKSDAVRRALATPDDELDDALGINYKKNGKRLGATFEKRSMFDSWLSPRTVEPARQNSLMYERSCRHEDAIESFRASVGSCPDRSAYLKHMREFIKFVEYSQKTHSNGFSKTDASHEFVQKVRGPNGGWHYYNEDEQHQQGLELAREPLILTKDCAGSMSLAPGKAPLNLADSIFEKGTLKFEEIGSGGVYGENRWMRLSLEGAVLKGGKALSDMKSEYDMGNPKAHPDDKRKYCKKHRSLYRSFASIVAKKLANGSRGIAWPKDLSSENWHTEGHLIAQGTAPEPHAFGRALATSSPRRTRSQTAPADGIISGMFRHPTFQIGDTIRVSADFTAMWSHRTIRQGTKGRVIRIGDIGDAQVLFSDRAALHPIQDCRAKEDGLRLLAGAVVARPEWVDKKDFHLLKTLDSEIDDNHATL